MFPNANCEEIFLHKKYANTFIELSGEKNHLRKVYYPFRKNYYQEV